MLKMHITLDSYILLRPVDILVAMPYSILSQQNNHKTIWALHPALSGASMFFDKLCVASYVDKNNCVFISPNLGNGYFINSKIEQQADFLQLELFPSLQNTLPLSKNKEDNFILGISAGAYGAINWIKNAPQNFSKAALISGCYSYFDEVDIKPRLCREQYAIYKLVLKKILLELAKTHQFPTDNNMTRILPTKDEVKDYTKLALFCGEEDYLSKPSTQVLYDKCKGIGLNVSLNMSSGGHDNVYWDKIFPQAMQWF